MLITFMSPSTKSVILPSETRNRFLFKLETALYFSLIKSVREAAVPCLSIERLPFSEFERVFRMILLEGYPTLY